MKRSIFLVLGLIGVGLVVLALGGCDSLPLTKTGPTPAVAAPTIPAGPMGRVVAEAEVVPLRYASLSFVSSGVIEEVYFEEGDLIEAGQILAVLEGREHLEAAVAAAELELLNAQQTPQYSDIRRAGHEGGEFIFVPIIIQPEVVVAPAAAPPPPDQAAEMAFWQAIAESERAFAREDALSTD